MEETIRILPCGDSALTLVLGDRVSEAVHRRVKAMELALRRAALPAASIMTPAGSCSASWRPPSAALLLRRKRRQRRGGW